MMLRGVVLLLAPAVASAQGKRPVAPLVDLATMAEIPAGSFAMGWPVQLASPYGDVWFEDQQPEHTVTLDTFHIDRHEVTVAEFAQFLTYAAGDLHFNPDQPIERVTDGYLPVAGSEAEPMRQVTWTAAAHYCAWARKRLPTEAEWERTATHTDNRAHPWGNDAPTCGRAVFFTGSVFCAAKPVAVGSRPQGDTPEGVSDLAGNVSEWTADWYGPYDSAPATHPTGPSTGTLKVVRGGSFVDGGLWVRAHARWGAPPQARAHDLGFRCAYSTPDNMIMRRGALALPADVGRMPRAAMAPRAPEPEVIAEGLQAPGALVALADRYVVLEAGLGRVVSISTGGVTEIAGGFGNLVGLATDGVDLFVTDRAAGQVWRVSLAGSVALVAGAQGNVGPVTADGAEVFWANDSALRKADLVSGEVTELLAGLDGVAAIALTPAEALFVEAGTASPSRSRLARIDRSGGSATTMVLASNLAVDPHRITSLALDAGGVAHFPIVMRDWPLSGRICRVALAGGATTCPSYSPPGLDRIAVNGTLVYWSTLRTVTRFAGSGPFTMAGAWARAGGMWAGDGVVVWTDVQSGRVQRVAP